MQICQTHWEELKAAIDARGLSQFIAKDGKEAIEHTVRELNGEDTVVDFEPLMGSNWWLSNAAMHYFGLAVMEPNEDGSNKCPVCMLQGINWIEMCADLGLNEAKKRGLVE
jgi:hypothetical protein